MAVTPVGNPYVESSDLVANYPGASEALAERIDIVGVNPFADSAARATAIPSPIEGMMSSLNDTDTVQRYDGATWKPVGGKIIQVIEGSTTTSVSITTTTMTDTGLTATITPTSATSKILVLLTQAGVNKQAGGTQAATKIRLMRDATQIALVSDFVGFTNSSLNLTVGNVSSSILDAPATTSATTYKTQFAGNDTTQVNVQVVSARSSIILVEVAA